MTSQKEKIVLAFSGGLDTCYCLWQLVKDGYEVHTVFISTGGISQAEVDEIEERANLLGSHTHHTLDAKQAIWDEFVIPLVWSGARMLGEYPLLCSDRYVIVRLSLELCDQLGTTRFAHGCTGMGNDQMRFDLTVMSLGDYTIHAPVRELQEKVSKVRDYEMDCLKDTPVDINAASKRYSINENLLGITISGSEIDEFQAPAEDSHVWSRPRSEWPEETYSCQLSFENGVAVALDGKKMAGPEIIKALNESFGAYGVGRHIYTGDVSLGLKGRIVFECPGIDSLLTAHKALNDAVNTKLQNQFHQQIAARWADLVYTGYFYEPHKEDLEAYLASSQSSVNGTVTLQTQGGTVTAVALESDMILQDADSVYAQSCTWSPQEAIGFIKLSGQSTVMSRRIRRQSNNSQG